MRGILRVAAAFALTAAIWFIAQADVEAGGVVPPRPTGKTTTDKTTTDKSAHRVDRKRHDTDTKHKTTHDITTTHHEHVVVHRHRAAYTKNDIAGAWNSDWGWMVLRTTHEKDRKVHSVTGYWVQDVNHKGVIPSGTYNPATRTFNCDLVQDWNNVKGTATFKLSADGWGLQGTWKHPGGSGEWAMKRVVGDDWKSQIDSLVADAGVTAETPGCAVMVIEHGKVIFEKGYGLANLDDKKSVATTTTFELASCSKQFTAAVIMRLHDQGKLSFDDDVRKYIPELPVYDAKHPIRILHLLHHSSGLPQYNELDYPKVAGRKPDYVTNEDYAKEYARQRAKHPLHFATGSKYEYNNGGYMLLALIAQRITHKPFHQVMNEEVFRPLGMHQSWVYDSPRIHPRNPAIGYGLNAHKKLEMTYGCPPHKNEYELMAGAWGLWTCLDDLVKWDRGWRSGKFFQPATLEAATRAWKTTGGQEETYGFGWGVGHDGGKVTWMSHGGDFGQSFCTNIYRNLAEDRTIVVLSNSNECELYWIRDGVERLCRSRKVAGPKEAP